MFELKDFIDIFSRLFSRRITPEISESVTLAVVIRTASAFAQVDLFFASSEKKGIRGRRHS